MKNNAPWLVLGIIFAVLSALFLLFLLGLVFLTIAIPALFGSGDGQQIDGAFTTDTIQACAFMAVTGLAFAGVSALGFVKAARRKKKTEQ